MFETIKQHYSRPLSIFSITREDAKRVTFWMCLWYMMDTYGYDSFLASLVAFAVVFPLYVWLFHMGEEEEPTFEYEG